MATVSAEVEAYLAALPAESRAMLEEIRRVVREIVPDATETISYRLPTFRHGGRPLVAYGATKSHCALYLLSTTVIPAHRDELASHDASGGTVRFPPGQALPATLVERLVRARLAENEQASGRY